MDNSQITLESMSQAIWYNQWTLKKFEPFLRGDILEVGCGIGSFTKVLINFGCVWAIDINHNYINATKTRVFKKAQVGFGNIEKGNYFFTNKGFDTIVCLNTLEHIKNDGKALRNMDKLLKEDGHLILLVPANPALYGNIDRSIGHYRRYGKCQIEKLINRHNFNVISLRSLNLFGALGWWFSGKILRNTVVSNNMLKIFNIIAPMVLRLEDIIEFPLGTSVLVIARKKRTRL